MDRNDAEALERRMFGTVSDDDSDSSAESNEDTDMATLREGVTRAIDPDDLSTMRRDWGLTEDDADARAERTGGLDPNRDLAQPPDLPESMDVTSIAPDGTDISRTLNSPTGEAVGGSALSDSIQSRSGALGGEALGASRLDPLGLLDSLGAGGAAPPSDREIERAVGRHDGSAVSKGTEPAPPPGGGTDPGDAEDPSRADDLIEKWSPKPPEDRDSGGPRPSGGGDEPPSDEEQPDPTGGYDVITDESIAAAIKLNDPGVYVQPTEDSAEGSATTVARAAAANDPEQITNYGPEGEQSVQPGTDWKPPVDTLFDPPPDSAGMSGNASGMADPAAAFGGASMIGSSTPDEAPPPPDPPPGEDPDQGPLGPPGGGGNDS